MDCIDILYIVPRFRCHKETNFRDERINMSNIKLADYYSAGYFLIRKNQRPFWLIDENNLVSQEMISLETQFCPQFNLYWGWSDNRRDKALAFGIDKTKLDELKEWCLYDRQDRVDVWGMFHSPAIARDFINRFIAKSTYDGLYIIGVGLHHTCLEDWQEPYGDEGVETRILQQLPMETGGDILGFDVAGYAHNAFDHTWFSHMHHMGIFQELGIRASEYGLLQTREEALQVRDYTDIHDKNMGYEYWLLVSYPLPSHL